MGQGRVLDAKQKLSRSLPALVAFKRIFRVKGADHMTNLNGASQNVEPVVCRPHQFDMLDFCPGTAPASCNKSVSLPLRNWFHPKVGAAVTDGHMTQHARRAIWVGVAPIDVTVLTRAVHNALCTILACADTTRLGRTFRAFQIKRVQSTGSTKDHPTPLALNVKPTLPSMGSPKNEN